MKKYNIKYKLGLLISFVSSLFTLILSSEKDHEFSLSRTIYACFFMYIFFYLVYIYKDKFQK